MDQDLIDSLGVGDDGQRLQAARRLREVMREQEEIPEQLVPSILSNVAQCLISEAEDELKTEGAWIIANLAEAGRIQSTETLQQHSIVQRLVTLLNSGSAGLREQVCLALGNIATESKHHRNAELETNIVDAIVSILQTRPVPNEGLLRSALWAVGNLCRNDRFESCSFNAVEAALLPIVDLLPLLPPVALKEALWTLSFFCLCSNPGSSQEERVPEGAAAVLEAPVLSFLQCNLASSPRGVQIPCIRIIGNLASVGKSSEINRIVEAGMLTLLPPLLQAERALEDMVEDEDDEDEQEEDEPPPAGVLTKEICWAVANITSEPQFVQAVIDVEGLTAGLVATLETDNTDTISEAAWAFANICSTGNDAHLRHLLHYRAHDGLFTVLDTTELSDEFEDDEDDDEQDEEERLDSLASNKALEMALTGIQAFISRLKDEPDPSAQGSKVSARLLKRIREAPDMVEKIEAMTDSSTPSLTEKAIQMLETIAFSAAHDAPPASEGSETIDPPASNDQGDQGGSSTAPTSSSDTFAISVPNAAELPADMFIEMTEELITNALGGPVPPRHPSGFTWPERGWSNKSQFIGEFRAGIQANGEGLVARGLSREEADELTAKLSANGLPAQLHGAGAAAMPTLHTVPSTIPPREAPPPSPSFTPPFGMFGGDDGPPCPPELLPTLLQRAERAADEGLSLRQALGLATMPESPTTGSESKDNDDGSAPYKLSPGEVGFDLEQGKSAKFKFSRKNRVATSPMGPVLLVSSPPDEKNISDLDSETQLLVQNTMRWRLRVSGNSSWSIGVVPESHMGESSYLANKGRVGITTTNDSLQRLEGIDGKVIDVVLDKRRRVVTYSMQTPTPHTLAQPLYEEQPVRLACSGYNNTSFQLLPFPEDEIPYAAIEMAVQNLSEGKPNEPTMPTGSVEYQPPDAVENDPEGLVNCRIRVKWAGNRHFAGKVSKYDPGPRTHTVDYDDGDIRVYKMREKKWYFQLMDDAGNPLHPTREGCKIGTRYTFHPQSPHTFSNRFPAGTIVRLVSIEPEISTRPPLRVQWEVTGFERNVSFEDLELITRETGVQEVCEKQGEDLVTLSNIQEGMQVERSSQWTFRNHDGGPGMTGSVQGWVSSDGTVSGKVKAEIPLHATVRWHSSGYSDVYPIGNRDRFFLKVSAQTELLEPEHGNSSPPIWEVKTDVGWKKYEDLINTKLEEIYQKYKGKTSGLVFRVPRIRVELRGTPYFIDLSTMAQSNAISGFKRKIRRRIPKAAANLAAAIAAAAADAADSCIDDSEDKSFDLLSIQDTEIHTAITQRLMTCFLESPRQMASGLRGPSSILNRVPLEKHDQFVSHGSEIAQNMILLLRLSAVCLFEGYDHLAEHSEFHSLLKKSSTGNRMFLFGFLWQALEALSPDAPPSPTEVSEESEVPSSLPPMLMRQFTGGMTARTTDPSMRFLQFVVCDMINDDFSLNQSIARRGQIREGTKVRLVEAQNSMDESSDDTAVGVVRRLVMSGSSVEAEVCWGDTENMHGIEELQAVESLADPTKGMLPLQYALWNDYPLSVIRFLLTKGADPDASGPEGSARDIAHKKSRPEVADLFTPLEDAAPLSAFVTETELSDLGKDCAKRLLTNLPKVMKHAMSSENLWKASLDLFTLTVEKGPVAAIQASNHELFGSFVSIVELTVSTNKHEKTASILEACATIVDVVPEAWAIFCRHGLHKIAEKLATNDSSASSKSKGDLLRLLAQRSLKQDHNDTGLAASVLLSKFQSWKAENPEPSLHGDDLRQALEQSSVNSVEVFCRQLLSASGLTSFELSTTPGLQEALSCFLDQRENITRILTWKSKHDTSETLGVRALCALIGKLQNNLSMNQNLPVYHRGERNLRELNKAMKLTLVHRNGATPEHTVRATPVAPIEELLRHILRAASMETCTEWLQWARGLVGCVVEVRGLVMAQVPNKNDSTEERRIGTVLDFDEKNFTHRIQWHSDLDESCPSPDAPSDVMRLSVREHRVLRRPVQLLEESPQKAEKQNDSATSEPPSDTENEPESLATNYVVAIRCPEILSKEEFLDLVRPTIPALRAVIMRVMEDISPPTQSKSNERYLWARAGWPRGHSEFEEHISRSVEQEGKFFFARGLSRKECTAFMTPLVEASQGQLTPEIVEGDFDSSAQNEQWPCFVGARVIAPLPLNHANLKVWTEGVVLETPDSPALVELCQHCRVKRRRSSRDPEEVMLTEEEVNWDEQGTVENISGDRVSVSWDNGRSDMHSREDLEPFIAVNTRIKRGPTWHYKDLQDGGVGNLGTCTGFSRQGVVRIHWDAGQPIENTYRIDKDNHEVIPASEEEKANSVVVLLEMGARHNYKISELCSAVPSGEPSLRDGARKLRSQKDFTTGARVTLKQGTKRLSGVVLSATTGKKTKLLYTIALDDGTCMTSVPRESLDGEDDDSQSPDSEWTQTTVTMSMDDMLRRGFRRLPRLGSSAGERRTQTVAPLSRIFSGVSTEMRSDGQDFLLGVGTNYDVSEAYKQSGVKSFSGLGAPENMLDQQFAPGLKVLMRLKKPSPPVAFRHKAHEHPIALVDEDFSSNWPNARISATRWRCDGIQDNGRQCTCQGLPSTVRYRCTQGKDFDLCEKCFQAGLLEKVIFHDATFASADSDCADTSENDDDEGGFIELSGSSTLFQAIQTLIDDHANKTEVNSTSLARWRMKYTLEFKVECPAPSRMDPPPTPIKMMGATTAKSPNREALLDKFKLRTQDHELEVALQPWLPDSTVRSIILLRTLSSQSHLVLSHLRKLAKLESASHPTNSNPHWIRAMSKEKKEELSKALQRAEKKLGAHFWCVAAVKNDLKHDFGVHGDLELQQLADWYYCSSSKSSEPKSKAAKDKANPTALESRWQNHWWNTVFDSALEAQLKDAVSIATQALPGWCSILTSSCPFLFNAQTRRRYLWCTAFGVSRAVEYLQQGDPQSNTTQLSNQLTQLNERVVAMYMTGQDPQALQAQADQIEDWIRQRRRNHIGVLKHDYVRGVRRTIVLSDARNIMASLASSRSALQVTFEGESGHGDGVTRGFYVAVAEQLQNRSANCGMNKLLSEALVFRTNDPHVLETDPYMLRPRTGDFLQIQDGLRQSTTTEDRVDTSGSNEKVDSNTSEKMEDQDEGKPKIRLTVAGVSPKGSSVWAMKCRDQLLSIKTNLQKAKDPVPVPEYVDELSSLGVDVHEGEGLMAMDRILSMISNRVEQLERSRVVETETPFPGPTVTNSRRTVWHIPRHGPIRCRLKVIAGPRLETSEDLSALVVPGDIITLRLSQSLGDEDDCGLQVSISSSQCPRIEDDSLQAQLDRVNRQLQCARTQNLNRSEIASLMRKRAELIKKRNTEATLAASLDGQQSEFKMDIGEDPNEARDVDDRMHAYSVLHVSPAAITLDRPVHANPDQTLVAAWPKEYFFVPDSTEEDGYLHNEFGLFPAPLKNLDGANQESLVVQMWFFIGQIMAKALQDGFIVPLPLSKLFFSILCGEKVDPVMLADPTSHMQGCAGEMVANMMSLLPALRAAGNDPKALSAIIDRPHPFTSQQTLGDLLANPDVPFEFSDPITGLALGSGANASVNRHNLLSYLEAVGDFWLSSGISRQVEAFRAGISQVFEWTAFLAFSPDELCSMMCGTDKIEWTEKTLKKMLKPTSGFSADSPTLDFLRAELISMDNMERQKFLKFATAVPRLVPDTVLTVACKGKGGSWLPTAQTCTPQINLPVYKTRQDLRLALREAVANAEADGGFHEREAGSDGDTSGGGGIQVELPSSFLGGSNDMEDEGSLDDDEDEEDGGGLFGEESDVEEDEDEDENEQEEGSGTGLFAEPGLFNWDMLGDSGDEDEDEDANDIFY